MSITVIEGHLSRPTEDSPNANQTRLFTATGSADPDEIITAVKASPDCPSTVAFQSWTLGRKSVIPKPIYVNINEPDKSFWKVTVRWARSGAAPEAGDSFFSFDTTGGVRHIEQAIATSAFNKDGPIADPPTGKTIGLTKDGVAGADIVIPVYAFTRRKHLANSTVTEAYKQKVRDLTGRVNNAAFEANDAEEVLLTGGSGERQGTGDWVVTFGFVAIENEVDATITVAATDDVAEHTITYSKKGHEYLDVRYQSAAKGEYRMEVPKTVYVHRVYRTGDFSDLEI